MSSTDDKMQWDSLVDKQLHLWQEQQKKLKKSQTENACPWDKAHLTISRCDGARGYRIGELVAKKLKWEVYSKSLVEYIADRSNIRQKVVADFDEKRKSRTLSQSLFEPTAYSSDKHYRHLVQVILTLAEHGRAVFVGRGACFITDKNRGLHVRVTAPLDYRIKRYANQQKISFSEARKKVENADNERAAFIRQYFHQDTADPNNYDLTINVEKLTNEQAAEMIIAAMEIKFGFPRPLQPKEDSSCDEEKSSV